MVHQLTVEYSQIIGASIPPQALIRLCFDGVTQEVRIDEGQTNSGQLSLNLVPTSNDPDDVLPWLRKLIAKPVVFSLIEVAVTKDKKGKESEKQTLIGQSCIDLLPYMKVGELQSSVKETLHLLNSSATTTPVMIGSSDNVAVENKVEVRIQSAQELLSKKMLGKFWNIVNYRCLTASVAEDILLKDEFVAVTSIIKENVSFSNLESDVGNLTHTSCKLRWSPASFGIEIDNATSKDEFIINNDTNFGDFVGSIGQREKANLDSKLSKIVLAMERRVLLTHTDMEQFENHIAKHRFLRLFAGTKLTDEPTTAKGAKNTAPNTAKSSNPSNKFKSLGLARVDLTGLLYPGCTRISGSFKLKDIDPDEVSQELSNVSYTTMPLSELVQINDGSITVDITTLHPIVKSHDKSDAIAALSELIPERGAWPRIERGATHAVQFLKTEIKKTAEYTLEQIRQSLGDVSKIPTAQREEARCKLFYDLTISSEYQQYREQLKYAIIRIVREKYLKTTKLENDSEREIFLSNLSIYLHEVLHETITEYFYVPTDTIDLKGSNHVQANNLQNYSGVVTPEQIIEFAKEAQSLGKNDVAERWYQELCAREQNNANNWFEYALFCLYKGNVDRAQECLFEAISIDQNHHKSLICAPFVLCLTKHSFDEENHNGESDFIKEGKIFLERAQFNNDDNPAVTWVLSALFHEFCMDSGKCLQASIMMEQAMLQAKQIESAQYADEFSVPSSCFLDAARYLIDCNLFTFAERALAHELYARGASVTLNAEQSLDMSSSDLTYINAHTNPKRLAEYNCLLGRLHMAQSEKLESAEELFTNATQIYHRFAEAWAMLGHVAYISNNKQKAKKCYRRVLDDGGVSTTNAEFLHLVFLNLGQIYLDEKQFGLAKEVFINSCTRETPTVHTWLGIGKACYYQQDYEEAEDALAEANMLDQRHPDVWVLLSAVCLRQILSKPNVSRKGEAEQSFKYAMKMGCTDRELLDELTRLQQQTGIGNPCF